MGVTQHYDTTPILENLSLQIDAGEVVAVLGPNGMGKTTLLRLIAGILTPAKGEVHVHGILRRSSAAGEQEIRSKTVFLPDEVWFPSSQSIREFVLAVAKLYGRDMIEAMKQADQLFDLFSLNDKADSSIASCSTGQRKKASLCAALITEASLLLLDEPFSGGLDPGGIVALKNVLRRITKDRLGQPVERTIVFTTPVPEIIEEVADKVVIIEEGNVLAFGSPAELCGQAGESRLENAIDKLLHTDTLERVERYFSNQTA